MPQQRKDSPEFKREAVELARQSSLSIRQVPLDLVEAVKYGLSGRKPKKS